MSRLVVIPGDPLYKYTRKGEVKARYWNPCGIFDEVHIISLVPQDVDAAEVQAVAGDAHLEVHPIGRPTPLSLLAYFGRVRRLVERLRPDIIRAHGPWQCGTLGVYAAGHLGIPSLVSVHNEIDVMRRHERPVMLNLVRPLERYSLSRASAVLCVSDYLHAYARRHGARRTLTAYNRVYTEQFAQSRDYTMGDTPTVLSVMRLDAQKDPATLIRSIADLDLRLVLVGHGELEQQLHELVRDLHMDERVEFVPMVPNRLIHETYAAADLFAMATRYEGFCIPVLEAMASGLPVVACNTDPIPEILGGTGLVVERRPEAFRDGFAQLLGDEQLRQRLGRAARARAAQLDGALMEEREAEIYSAFMAADAERIARLDTDAFRFMSAPTQH
jgi:glycosyltransferase involved in cell wall biosynthesis